MPTPNLLPHRLPAKTRDRQKPHLVLLPLHNETRAVPSSSVRAHAKSAGFAVAIGALAVEVAAVPYHFDAVVVALMIIPVCDFNNAGPGHPGYTAWSHVGGVEAVAEAGFGEGDCFDCWGCHSACWKESWVGVGVACYSEIGERFFFFVNEGVSVGLVDKTGVGIETSLNDMGCWLRPLRRLSDLAWVSAGVSVAASMIG